MSTYRSVGMLKPPHGLRGHTLLIIKPGNPGAPPLIPPEPHLWQCHKCHISGTDTHIITKDWCPDAHLALTRYT